MAAISASNIFHLVIVGLYKKSVRSLRWIHGRRHKGSQVVGAVPTPEILLKTKTRNSEKTLNNNKKNTRTDLFKLKFCAYPGKYLQIRPCLGL